MFQKRFKMAQRLRFHTKWLGWLATTFNRIKTSSFFLYFTQGKNSFSWRLFAAFPLFEPEIWAGSLYMSHEMSLLNWTSTLQEQCDGRKSNPFTRKNNFILKATAGSYIWPCSSTGQGHGCQSIEKVSFQREGAPTFQPPPKPLGSEKVDTPWETSAWRSEHVSVPSPPLLVQECLQQGVWGLGCPCLARNMWGRLLRSQRYQRLLRKSNPQELENSILNCSTQSILLEV